LLWSRDQKLPRSPSLPRKPLKVKVGRRVPVERDRVQNLTRNVRSQFEHSRPIDDDAYLKPFKKLLVDITTSMACLDRALEFANLLFNSMEALGHRVIIAPPTLNLSRISIDERANRQGENRSWVRFGSLWTPMRPTVVFIGDVAIGLAILEMSEEVPMRYVRGKYVRVSQGEATRRRDSVLGATWTTMRPVPSGRLSLVAYSPYRRVKWFEEWEETDKATLEDRVRGIAFSLEKSAIELVGKIEEAERQARIEHQAHLEAQERWRREEDKRLVEQSIRDSREQLAQVIQEWSRATDVEWFLAGVKDRADCLPAPQPALVEERLRLAQELLGSTDPMDFIKAWKTPAERYQPRFSNP
jgi:hypothetical protein